MTEQLPDSLKEIIGAEVHDGEYHVVEYHKKGKRGYLFRAQRKSGGERALKFLERRKLTRGWEQEALKAHMLEKQPNTVRFYEFFFHKEYAVLVFDFIDGKTLREWIEDGRLTVADCERVLYTLLFFRNDCLTLGVRHGDLHPGNIILHKPVMGPPRAYEVMITDFGIGYTGAVLQPKDDLSQIGSIATWMLQSITRETLDHTDRLVYEELCHGPALKSIREASPLERGEENAAIRRGVEEIQQVRTRASAPASPPIVELRFSDYLAGEQLGDRWVEWKRLFVPTFPGYEDVVSRHVTVLTGTRGCGKTMVFRRLSQLLSFQVGPVDQEAGTRFVGFYLNMNDVGDAFLTANKGRSSNDNLARRVMQFFHLSLLSEVVRVAGVARQKAGNEQQSDACANGNRWLFEFVRQQINSEALYPGPEGVTSTITAELERAKDEVRRPTRQSDKLLPLGEADWLARFVPYLQKAMPWISQKPVYFFLDDYSLPRVNATLQTILNSIVFRRADSFFFKISTESPSTLCRKDYSGKELQDPDDFELTDLGSVTIDLPDDERGKFLDEIFQRRLAREERLRGRSLAEFLGRFDKSWAQLAREIRGEPERSGNDKEEEGSGRVLYYGREVFVNLWSGDTREMVRIGLSLLQQLPPNGMPQLPIDKGAQDKVFRRAGGEFLHLLQACTRTLRGDSHKLPSHMTSWGQHLVKIAEAFKDIALFELKTRQGGRTGRGEEPKQAFRIEIVDQLALEGIEKEIYEDLVRYGVFLRDDRGKSVRGAVIPRLYLRRLLIPFCTLTFSKIDNVALKASDFRNLLWRPGELAGEWKRNRTRFETGQKELFE